MQRVAFVKDSYASAFSYALSHFLSYLLILPSGLVEGNGPLYSLARAEWHLEHGDVDLVGWGAIREGFLPVRDTCLPAMCAHACAQCVHLVSTTLGIQAARELNQLQGAARDVAQDWLADARAYLTAQQALAVSQAHTALQSLSLTESKVREE